MTNYIIARPQYFITDLGTQYTSGYDQRTVVGYGRTLRAAARRAGAWATQSGYRVFLEHADTDLGILRIEHDHARRRDIYYTERETYAEDGSFIGVTVTS